MNNKKKTILVIVCSILIVFMSIRIILFFSPHSSTTSILKIVQKGHSSDYKVFWIKAYDPQNHSKDESFKILINEPKVWNLIEEDREYMSTYEKEEAKPCVLTHIAYIGDKNGLRY